MGLSNDDVREILRLVDESELDELRVETNGFTLHVLRDKNETVQAAAAPASDGTTVDSPMLGTFYRAPAPGATPFVEIGAQVDPETTVCLIEVMKMMNSIRAGVSGTIAEILVENADLVEEGQPLFRIA
ncbi:MAG TPA: biotin/lipoyl-containing protein [Gaiellaceae bacterium]|nr:biotin/lipoyl-containing protein [Gaiellaceae bacterium]